MPVDPIEKALFELLDDAGDALFSVAYINLIDGELFEESFSKAKKLSYEANDEQGLIVNLQESAISIASATAQYAYHTMVKGMEPGKLEKRPKNSVNAFLASLSILLQAAGLSLSDAMARNEKKLDPNGEYVKSTY